jgi:phage head maturation protease
MSTAPTDNLFRGLVGAPVEFRSDEGDDNGEGRGTTLFGHFARFDEWNEIDSWYEGRFLERVAKGAYTKTFKERAGRIRSQFDHGHDSYFGSSPLGVFEVLREEDEGPYYEVALLDTDYNRDRLVPMLGGYTIDGRSLGSVLGASYRFRVISEEWVDPKTATAWNPSRLPERTIKEIMLYEAGPVVFGADEMATAGIRSVSLTDRYIARQIARSGQAARAAEQLAQIAGEAVSSTSQANTEEPPEALVGASGATRTKTQRMALAVLTLNKENTA